MFSRRKKNYRVVLTTALIICICILIAVILWPNPVETAIDEVNANTQTNNTTRDSNVDINDNLKNDNLIQNNEDNEANTNSSTSSYYIVKKNDDVISVYFVTEKGEWVKLEDTDILYELLPVEDQLKFEKGIKLQRQEELMSLLQDFES